MTLHHQRPAPCSFSTAELLQVLAFHCKLVALTVIELIVAIIFNLALVLLNTA